jgi:hypothetical protein
MKSVYVIENRRPSFTIEGFYGISSLLVDLLVRNCQRGEAEKWIVCCTVCSFALGLLLSFT